LRASATSGVVWNAKTGASGQAATCAPFNRLVTKEATATAATTRNQDAIRDRVAASTNVRGPTTAAARGIPRTASVESTAGVDGLPANIDVEKLACGDGQRCGELSSEALSIIPLVAALGPLEHDVEGSDSRGDLEGLLRAIEGQRAHRRLAGNFDTRDVGANHCSSSVVHRTE
jgi:hypothetical protein